MMDGQVAAIRAALDREGFTSIPVLSYSAKYASAFYGPFRDAADGAPKFGDRRSHQMDPANGREALLEQATDVAEGADMLMVKGGVSRPSAGGVQRERRVRHGEGRRGEGMDR
jgi:porphobilinogen synthase